MEKDHVLGKAYDSRLMKRLLVFIKPYKWTIGAAILLLFGNSVLQLVGPYLIKVGIDRYIMTGDMAGLRFIALLYIASLSGAFIIRFGEMYLTQWIGQNVMYDLRKAIFGHLQRLSLSFFDKNPVGRLITRVTSDVDALNEMVTSGLVTIFGNIFMVLGIMIAMLWMNWKLALVTLSVLPLLFYAAFLFKTKVRDSFRHVRTRIAIINSFLQENITGMRIVQLFNREAHNYTRFDKVNADHLESNLQTIFYFAIFFPVVRLISAVAVALIIWYGGRQILAAEITFGILVAFLQYADQFYRPIQELSEKYNIFQNAMASSERVFKLLDEEVLIQNKADPVFTNTFNHKIEFRNVWFTYDLRHFVLKDVSFVVNKGDSVALVGATGSGKTTIISLLCRFYDIAMGQILIDEVDIRDYDLKTLREFFGLVLQDVFLFSGTIEENIRLSNDAFTASEIRDAAKRARAHEFIKKLPQQYREEVKERGSTLSVGQKQLLSFARALVYDPQILILDEATSNIDTETEQLIQQALDVLMEDRTSIIIAHRLSTIKHVNRILVLHKGQVREQGSHDELLAKRGLYYKLYQLQYKEEQWA